MKDEILAPNELIRVKLFGDGQITTITNPKKLKKENGLSPGLGLGLGVRVKFEGLRLCGSHLESQPEREPSS